MTRGSEWRKWDLHVHSYNTKMNNQYGTVTFDEYLQALEDSDIKVFGITDYFNVETQLETIEKFQKKFPGSEKKFFVNIEFRLDLNVSTENAGHANVHLLFDPTEKRLKNFADSLYLTQTNDNNTYRKMSSLSEHEFDGATIKFDEIEKRLKEIFGNEKPYFWVMAAGGHGGIRPNGAMRNNLLSDELDKKTDFLFGSVTNTNYYLDIDGKGESGHRYSNSIPKAVISASDAHRLVRENEETGIGDQFTWIKAEPTLEGLRQIIFEPESRVKIQDTAPDYKEPYYVIDHVEFTQNGHLKKVYFNPNLNAIIGGRSNGKSTLTNTIAKTLNNDVFLQKTNDGVKMFTLNESSQTDDFRIIWSGENKANHEREIMFFPQDYMIHIAEHTDELNNIVDSVVQSDKKMYGKLQQYNDQVRQTTESIKRHLQELAHVYSNLEKAKQLRPEGDLDGIKANLDTIKSKISEIKRSSSFNEEIQTQYEAKHRELRDNLNTKRLAGINLDEIASRDNDRIIVDTKPVASDDYLFNQQLNELKTRVEQTAKTAWENGLETMRREQEKKLSDSDQKIADIKASHEYVAGHDLLQANQELKELDNRKNQEATKVDTFEAYIVTNEGLTQKVSEIKKRIVEEYLSLSQYRADLISEFSSKPKSRNEMIEITVDFERIPFTDGISYLDSRKKNNRDFIDEFDKNSDGNIVRKLIFGDLELSYNQGKTDFNLIEDIFTVNWYKMNYILKYDDDKFNEMSQGKKAFVILTLILEFSTEKKPVIIDQPEDSLDNRTIFADLTNYLRDKKKERQIIVVTHNPNVVVGADTENVIVANQNSRNSPNRQNDKFDYLNGSLENTQAKNTAVQYALNQQGIREHVIEILEGGREAFAKRENKYDF